MSDLIMPAAFLGHGSPMNALEHNRYTEAWRTFGASVPRPRAILMVSAHWHVNATAVTAMARPRTIHDFHGFPPALFAMQYPAPGLPEVVDEIAQLVQPDIIDTVYADTEHWGLDHGTWSVLCHAFPEADIPVVQLSINASQPAHYHVAMGARLNALRQRGILVMGSGNVVHNLRLLNWNTPEAGTEWAQRFDEHARELMRERPGDIASLAGHRDYALAVPTDEHLLPLFYIAGLAAESGDRVQVLTEGYAFGSLSMTAYTVGMCAQTS